MILNEDYGNMRALSPNAIQFIKYIRGINERVGRNSEIKIVKEHSIENVLKQYTPQSLPLIILRYKGVDKVYFYMNSENDKYWSISYNNYDDKWYRIIPVGVIGSDNFESKIIDGLKIVYKDYQNEVPTFEEFLKGISYQLIFTDVERLQTQAKREKEKGDIYQTTKDKTYQTTDDFYRNYHKDKAYNHKVHGSIYDKRDTGSYYSNSLKERLKKYVESKFPSFNSLEDFVNANIKDILKAFKINGYIYKYDNYGTNTINKTNTDSSTLYELYLKKKAYIAYEREGRYMDNLPKHIIFEVVLDINNNVKVSNIYEIETFIDLKTLTPLSDLIKQKETKKEDNKSTHNYNTDEEDDW
jgi:hypothetical protein